MELKDLQRAGIMFGLALIAIAVFTRMDFTPYSGEETEVETIEVGDPQPEVAFGSSPFARFSKVKLRHWTKENRELAIIQYNEDWYDKYGFQISTAWGGKHNVLKTEQIDAIEKLITGIEVVDEAGERRTGVLDPERYQVVYNAAKMCGNISYSYGADETKWLIPRTENEPIDVYREGQGNKGGGTPLIPTSLDCSGFAQWIFATCRLELDPENLDTNCNYIYQQCIPRRIYDYSGGAVDKLAPGDLVFWGYSTSSLTHVAIFVAYAPDGDIYVIEECCLGEDDQIVFFADEASPDDRKAKAIGSVCFAKHTVGSSSLRYAGRPMCYTNSDPYSIESGYVPQGEIEYNEPEIMQTTPLDFESIIEDEDWDEG